MSEEQTAPTDAERIAALEAEVQSLSSQLTKFTERDAEHQIRHNVLRERAAQREKEVEDTLVYANQQHHKLTQTEALLATIQNTSATGAPINPPADDKRPNRRSRRTANKPTTEG